MDVRQELLSQTDRKYAMFSDRLVSSRYRILGVRLPILRDIAKRIAAGDWESYLDNWECEFLEDMMLRGFVISYAKMSFDERLRRFAEFIPLIDNWSVCDSFCNTWKPKKRDEREKLWEFILPYLDTDEEFQMRYPVVMMLTHFIDGEHIDDVLDHVGRYRHDGYYYKMGVAWNISVCYVKFPEKTMDFLKTCTLDDWTYNKSIQKIIESYRVSDEDKDILRKMKRVS